jgi:hypothetical protein
MRRLLPLLLALLPSCGGDALPADLPGLLTVAKDSCDLAQKARGDGEPKTAEKAAERAKKAYDAAGPLAKTPAEQLVVVEIRSAAMAARRFARLAREEKERQDRTTGLKARAYRTGRKAALAGTFHGLALAADQEAKGGTVPQGVHESALLAASISEGFAGRSKNEDGSTDWTGVAADNRKFAEALPPAMSIFLASALMLSRQDGLALVEIESLDAASIQDPGQLVTRHIVRGIILRLNGMPESASDAFVAAGAAPGSFGPELEAGMHLIVAASKIMDEDLEAADLEIVRAMKVWPNNPVAVFLTGERLGALGEREAAAKSLEASLAGTDQEWLAKRLAARTRELRDGQGPAQPLIMDPGFLRDVALWQVWQAARTSPAARKLQKMVESARGFASRWTPGGDSEK